jgi:NitT/TauT family transport system permease protein
MNPRKLGLGFVLAAAGMLLALVLPLSSEATAPLPARPTLLALTLAAALLFAASAWAGGSRAVILGFAGVLCGAATTLALLRNPAIAGSAASGFWSMVLAVWLASALCVMQLASTRPRDRGLRRALNPAIPLLFGAVVFYLWEVSVRGFGVSPVIMPAPSAAAARFFAS